MKNYHYNLGQYFDEIVAGHSDRPALRYHDHNVSYADLSAWAESLAALLRAKGLAGGDVIAIGHNKQAMSYALMLAALRLGVVYVNIDVASPLARNARILEVSGASLLFYDDPKYAADMRELALGTGREAVELTPQVLPAVSEPEREAQQRLMQEVDGACIAYVMFTSGSTGVPKGVAVTHQNVLHFIAWGRQQFQIGSQANFANLSPMYFDNSVFDFYVALFSGASLSPIHRDLVAKPYELVAHVAKMRCNMWFSVPSLLIYLNAMKALTAKGLPELRNIVFGGEGYPKPELKKLYDTFSAQAVLTNVYGPTECTCICSAYRLGARDFEALDGLPPLGYLNQNFDYLILDEQDQEQEAQTGELCLIGPNVAAGYFNDLERSAASFFTLHDSKHFMKRMYRTGDLVQKIDGMLHFVGRKDNQIKHMGYRIELEEIEHALMKLRQVEQAAVIYHRTNAAYGKLVAYVACSGQPEERDLLKALANLLPDYMVPNKLIVMSELPKNPNGKVDRQHLLALLG
ncbi:MAG: amino acid adenylation domain-containing protein, partial [Gammaproteobacteria bacterium]|nr:amino acid adenylation domain-containing protein [Gammaproteobacteria bacterium]